MVDDRKAGNTDKQGNKCLKVSWISTGIYLECRHIQDRFITSAWIYGRGAVMLRLLMDCRKVYTYRARTFGVSWSGHTGAHWCCSLISFWGGFLYIFECLLNKSCVFESSLQQDFIQRISLWFRQMWPSGPGEDWKLRYLGKLPNKAVLIRVKAVFFLGDWTTRQKK